MTGILIWMVRAKPNENSTLWRDEVSPNYDLLKNEYPKSLTALGLSRIVVVYKILRVCFGLNLLQNADWFKNLELPHPIRSKTNSNRDAFAYVFPSFASATCTSFTSLIRLSMSFVVGQDDCFGFTILRMVFPWVSKSNWFCFGFGFTILN